MRLIDADALTTDINSLKIWHNNNGHKELLTPSDLIDRIKAAPTIEPPVVHGKWIVIGMRPCGTKLTHYCSICGGHGNDEINFCHNCGAKMTEE